MQYIMITNIAGIAMSKSEASHKWSQLIRLCPAANTHHTSGGSRFKGLLNLNATGN
jgi:hypothetical protein